MRKLLRPVLIFLAVIFLIEAWLWDHLAPVVARVVNLIPLARFKAWLAEAAALGLKVGPWGLSANADIDRMLDLGVFSVTVSGPGWGRGRGEDADNGEL